MCSERYPQDLVVSLRDFETSGWKEVVAKASSKDYSQMWRALSEAARNAIEQGRPEHGKVLWLLADACSMTLSPLSSNEPFKPLWIINGRRSVIPDDFSDIDIAFFAEISEAIDENKLKARVCDLVWLMGKPRNRKFALNAIDAYRSLPFSRGENRECWSRAICLAKQLKGSAGDKLKEMESFILAAFDTVTMRDGFLGRELADFLKSNKIGCERRTYIAEKLGALARGFEGFIAWKYFDAATEWYKSASDSSKVAEMRAATAECLAQEAIAQTTSDSPDYITAVNLCEQAIQKCQDVPIRERPKYRVDEKIAELRALLNEFGKKSLGNMRVVQTPCIDMTDTVAKARKFVSGKSAKDALLAFANLHCECNVDELRERALERVCQHPLQFLFPATVMSSDGRVIAKRPAMGLGADWAADDNKTIHAAMIDDFGCTVGCLVLSGIVPALEVLQLEHRLRESDFIELASGSPFVPPERAGLWGKALFAGYERDFMTAAHLLIPQIEHLVRAHLKLAGAKTSIIGKDGIQTENGLSNLLNLQEAEQVFGKNLTFELKALFCDALGPNLRNVLAHGLLDEEGCNSPFVIYAWWLALRHTFNTWWNCTPPEARRVAHTD